ncbi:hypothetical protein BH11PSE8_BH11PSE8_38550 [soil metagenome]
MAQTYRQEYRQNYRPAPVLRIPRWVRHVWHWL